MRRTVSPRHKRGTVLLSIYIRTTMNFAIVITLRKRSLIVIDSVDIRATLFGGPQHTDLARILLSEDVDLATAGRQRGRESYCHLSRNRARPITRISLIFSACSDVSSQVPGPCSERSLPCYKQQGKSTQQGSSAVFTQCLRLESGFRYGNDCLIA